MKAKILKKTYPKKRKDAAIWIMEYAASFDFLTEEEIKNLYVCLCNVWECKA